MKIFKFILSETTSHRALIFGMHRHLVNRYQIRSNFGIGAKNGPALEVTYFMKAFIGNTCIWRILSETTRPRALIFGM